MWHALVGKEQGHTVVAQLQFVQQIKGAFRRIASDNAVFRAVLRTKIALNRAQNVGIVVHRQ
jgi:hypothetical protein